MRWAALVPKDQLPPILREKHKDWPRLFQWVPRRWTAFVGKPPRKILGNAEASKPIPDPGQWWIGLPPYFAIQTKSRWHIRAGFRWDDVDGYYSLSFTVKRFK